MNPSILPPKDNPFIKNNIYNRLNISPLSTETEIKAAVENLNLNDVHPEQRKAEMEQIKKTEAFLHRAIGRVGINALVFDEVDLTMVSERLKNLPNLTTAPITFPEPELTLVFMEGKSLEISQQDFHPAEPDPSLEIDLDIVKQFVTEKQEEKIILFET